MSIFQRVTLNWSGDDYIIEPDQVMRLIAVIEEHIRLADLVGDKGPSLAKLSMAYGAALRFAGARVGDEEIYKSFFDAGPQIATTLSMQLLSMMIPPESMNLGEGDKKKAAPIKD